MTSRILIIDENQEMLTALAATLTLAGYTVDVARNLPAAARRFAVWGHRVVVIDLLIVDRGIHNLISGILGAMPGTRVIVTTASGSMKQAAEGINMGAFDFLVKPFDGPRLLGVVTNAIHTQDTLPPSLEPSLGVIQRIYPYLNGAAAQFIAQKAPSTAPVLVKGPKGVLKARCAALFHQLSAQKPGLFVAVDCAAQNPKSFTELIPAELRIQGGTVFLDDICKLTLKVQTQILWFLQTGLLPDKNGRPRQVSLRLICSISAQPEAELNAGRLREDLYYRLNVVSLDLPGLTEGPVLASELARDLLAQQTQALGKPDIIPEPEVAEIFNTYSWPGNQAELLALVQHIAAQDVGPVLTFDLLPKSFWKSYNAEQNQMVQQRRESGLTGQVVSLTESADPYEAALRKIARMGKSLAEIERDIIETTIHQCQGSIPRAAMHLAVSPSTIYRKRDSWEER